MKLSLKEIIEISKQPMYKDYYVIAYTDSVMNNTYNCLTLPTIKLLEIWYSTFCDKFKSVVIYQNGKRLPQPDRMN